MQPLQLIRRAVTTLLGTSMVGVDADPSAAQRPKANLDEALRVAGQSAEHLASFYAALFEATVFVKGTAGGPAGRVTLPSGTALDIFVERRADGVDVIPIFSSDERLELTVDAIGGQMKLPARDLFEVATGATFVVNPGSRFVRTVSPEEIARLARGERRSAVARRFFSSAAAPPAMLAKPEDLADSSRRQQVLDELLARTFLDRAYLPQLVQALTAGPVFLLASWDANDPDTRAITLYPLSPAAPSSHAIYTELRYLDAVIQNARDAGDETSARFMRDRRVSATLAILLSVLPDDRLLVVNPGTRHCVEVLVSELRARERAPD